jgi:hypothetical protein
VGSDFRRILKYLGRKIVTNGNVKEEITKLIKNAGTFYHILWK